VIIGLLLGGILKGQELINSARVRNLADTNSGIQAAYFGFIDRYRRVPGDMKKDEANTAIGVTINAGGDNDGRLDDGSGTTVWGEAAAVWEHLSKAGFIQGSYDGLNGGVGGSVPATQEGYQGAGAPVNVFNGTLVLGRTGDYQGNNPTRLNLVLGRQLPVDIARELDVKIDDGRPTTGVLRLTHSDTKKAEFGLIGQYDDGTDCITTTTDSSGTTTSTSNDYDVAGAGQDCNVTFLY